MDIRLVIENVPARRYYVVYDTTNQRITAAVGRQSGFYCSGQEVANILRKLEAILATT